MAKRSSSSALGYRARFSHAARSGGPAAASRLFALHERLAAGRPTDSSLGRFTGDNEVIVRLRFNTTAAPHLRERSWHASQTIAKQTDGSIEVTLRLNNLVDVQRRVLSSGRHVEVLAPPELRASVAAELHAMAQSYGAEIETIQKAATKIAVGHPVSPQAR